MRCYYLCNSKFEKPFAFYRPCPILHGRAKFRILRLWRLVITWGS